MKFYGKDTVWDRKNNKVLCQFIDGELETEDERTIKILTKLGYEIGETEDKETIANEETQELVDSGEAEMGEEIKLEELNYKELSKLAKQKGVKAVGVKKDVLIKILKGE